MRNLEIDQLGTRIIGLCIDVHKELGAGLLESSYERALCYELSQSYLKFQRQQKLPVVYKGIKLKSEYVIDLLIENQIILELKAVENLLPIHEAQLLTYMKLSKINLGYLINFNVSILKNGIKRNILN